MTRYLPTLLAFAAVLASPAAGAQAAPSVEVRLVDPVHFTDFRVDRWRSKRQAESLARELGGFIERESRRHLPPGSKLTVTVIDVDMAGEYEAFQRTGAGDVRVVRDMYPSRVNLFFTLVDEAGNVVKEGERKLMSNFVLSPAWGGDGPLRHEKALLQDWFAREFPAGR